MVFTKLRRRFGSTKSKVIRFLSFQSDDILQCPVVHIITTIAVGIIVVSTLCVSVHLRADMKSAPYFATVIPK